MFQEAFLENKSSSAGFTLVSFTEFVDEDHVTGEGAFVLENLAANCASFRLRFLFFVVIIFVFNVVETKTKDLVTFGTFP